MSATKCETCNGSGMVAIGPWGSRPQRKACDACFGVGFTIAPRDARLDARMLGDLREWRRRLGVVPERPTFSITVEELDMLLSIADERDELLRELGADTRLEPEPLPAKITRPMPIVEISIEPDDEPKSWPCLTCGEMLRVNPLARLGEWRYEHTSGVDAHDPIRAPKA